jgi:hypothetical protein
MLPLQTVRLSGKTVRPFSSVIPGAEPSSRKLASIRKVAGLVYVSALSPDAGETTGKQYEGFAPATEFVIETTKDGFGYVSPAKFKAGFAHDVSDAEAAFMSASQVPINMSAFGTKLENAAWRTKPSWAVIATEDKAFDQAMLNHTDMNPAHGPFSDPMRQLTASSRFGEGVEIGHAVAYLASEKARYVTGTTLTVDGGANA